MSRPEHQAPPEIFYNDNEAEKYTKSSRIQSIQSEMTERCLELLNLPSQSNDSQEDYSGLILDIGCGSGLSGEIISEYGHQWVGADISGSMLEIALDREVEGDLCLHDIGQGFGFRAGSFDGAISVSVIQWLCNADKSCNSPPKRLKAFFETLFGALVRGAERYFNSIPNQMIKLDPNSQKAKKFYLVLMTGPSPHSTNSTNNNGNQLPQGLTTEDSNRVVKYSKKSNKKLNKRKSGTKNRVNVVILNKPGFIKRKNFIEIVGKKMFQETRNSQVENGKLNSKILMPTNTIIVKT
ncbi:hypothetical protein PSTT_02091 [Puccinia striiformis]|uniref:Methyltransferase type 11 domain-containing protein n=1 Tax=Puccinia striiformis TaxID=27350 RepID=A0A2S4W197_9BASI|nr:hypothetical protein PSTT_02091 [Puccinia striiformis]